VVETGTGGQLLLSREKALAFGVPPHAQYHWVAAWRRERPEGSVRARWATSLIIWGEKKVITKKIAEGELVQAYLVAASIPLPSDDKIQALLRATGGT
jgi:hypothetical protein